MKGIKEYFFDDSVDVLFGCRRKIGIIEERILRELSAGDMLMSILLSAGSTRAMYRESYKRAKARYAIRKAITRLKKQGLVTSPKRDSEMLMLTAMGRAVVMREVDILRAGKNGSKWDGKWRIVAFDIPHENRMTRNALRRLLERAEFKQAQKSVYIYPYPCDMLVALLREDKRLANFVFFFSADTITAEEDWKRKFGLR